MAWLYLFIAAGFEMVWAVGLKYTDGFTRALPSAITLTGLAFSMYFLSLALRTIPIGTALRFGPVSVLPASLWLV